MTAAARHKAGFVLGAFALVVVSAAALGLSTRRVDLNFGPGDSPFLTGFQANSDVDNKVGWHWTTYNARVDLPLRAHASKVDLTLRYARMFGEEAVVDVQVASVPTERFRARGGAVRSTRLTASGVEGDLSISIQVDSHEKRDMGLRMDRLSIETSADAPLRLRGTAAIRPVLALVALFAGLLALGASGPLAGGVAFLGATAFAAGASHDLFGAWRMVRLVPEMLVVSTLVLWVVRRWLEGFMSMKRSHAVPLVAAALVTMLCRLLLMSHPDFYYPDLLTHTRVVEAISTEGPGFYLHPADALNAQGAWTKPVLGSVSSLPYAVLFHSPFALLAFWGELSTDQIETALKAGSALISVLPIPLAGALAVRLCMPPLSALVLCLIPAYTSRLSFALMPSLLGHVFDLIVLVTLSVALARDRLESTRSRLQVGAALLVGHLAYTSSVVNEGAFVAVLALLCLAPGSSARPVGLRLLMLEIGAALFAYALYYRHFVGDVAGLFTRFLGFGSAGDASAASVYAVESFVGLLIERTGAFFGWSYLGLAALGAALAGRVIARGRIVPAWAVAFLLLIFLRAKVPDVFRYGHETLFLTPLVALLAGAGLILMWDRRGSLRVTAVAMGAALALVSLWEQWRALADQLGNAL